MALAALIAAYHESAEPGLLRAALPLAGRTVIERQARLAHAAGAGRIIVLVERMPPGLSAALDRLRRERLPLQVARSVEEAAETIDPADRLLVVADGAIAGADALEKLAGGEGAAVLTVSDSLYGELYERIDATSRWAGLAMMDGAMLRDTAAMLRDWDLQSTLLRRALQAGARHIAAEAPVTILDGPADLAVAERGILEGARGIDGSWAARLLGPLENAATGLVMATPIRAGAIGGGGAALTGLGALGFAYGWLKTGLALMLLATPLDGIASRLTRLRMQRDARNSWWRWLLPAFAGAGLLALAWTLMPVDGWGTLLLPLVTLAFLIAQGIETKGHRIGGHLLLADRKGMTWLMLPFALFGVWTAGLAALFAYAGGSFFWAQHEAHRERPKAGLD